MKYIPQPGDIIKCTNTNAYATLADRSPMISKGDKFKVLMAFQSDLTGNNYNVTVTPLSDDHNGLRLYLRYRADTREFSYYDKNTLHAVLLKDETFAQVLNFKPSVGDTVYHVIGEKVTKQTVYIDSYDNTLMVNGGAEIVFDEYTTATLVSTPKKPVKIFRYNEKSYEILSAVYGKDSVPKPPTGITKRRIDVIDSLFESQEVVIVLLDNKPAIAQDLFADSRIKIDGEWVSFDKHEIIPVDYNLKEITSSIRVCKPSIVDQYF